MYQQCGRGITGLASAPGLDVLLAPAWTTRIGRLKSSFRTFCAAISNWWMKHSKQFVLDLSARIMDFLLREQAVLRTATTVQTDINRLLGREQPKRAISAADINVHNLMQGFDPERLPYLIDELERLLDIHIDLDMDILAITRRDAVA